MGSQQREFEQKICEIQRQLAGQNLSIQTYIRNNENIQQKIAVLNSPVDFQDILGEAPVPKIIAITDGKLLTPGSMCELNEDKYDIVMDCIDRKLRARKDPDKRHTKPEECECEDTGSDRLKLLRYMIEHPKVPVCEETIPYVFGGIASLTPNALAHAIGALRKCLWQAPYIITVNDWGESVSHTGSVYLLNDKYKYLVIRWQI